MDQIFPETLASASCFFKLDIQGLLLQVTHVSQLSNQKGKKMGVICYFFFSMQACLFVHREKKGDGTDTVTDLSHLIKNQMGFLG